MDLLQQIQPLDVKDCEHDLKIGTIGDRGIKRKTFAKKINGIVKYIYEKTNGEIPIIASGGIFTGQMQKKNLMPEHHWYRFGQVLFMKDRGL